MLRPGHIESLARTVLLAGLLSACSQGNVGDADTSSAGIPTGIERFLLFPNPLVLSGGGFETNTTAYADAYYRAVDPNVQRDTLDKWKVVNGFGSGGNEHLVVFRDVRDLGYGRRMTGRRNADGTVAFFVENYSITGVPGGYTAANVDAAVVRDTQWHIGTNAIEWTDTPCDPSADPGDCSGTARILKFFNFSSATGERQLAVDLDGKGLKAMPGPCITCHGGRGDPLTPVEVTTSKPRYALVENSVSRKRGDTQARYQGFNVDSFEFAPVTGYTRSDQEAKLKDFNQWVLCTYPGGGSVVGAWGSCTRPAAGADEWQGTAAEMIEAWYGGSGMPNAQFSDAYLPSGWSGNSALYNGVVAPYCRTCHNVRGTANENDIDFSSEAKFQRYADRIKVHVFDRGNMPLAWIVYQDFWRSPAVGTLAAYIDSILGAGTVTTASGALREPGHPVADPGPTVRMVKAGANAPLSGADSLFASSYSWSQIAGPARTTITNANSRDATFFSNTVGVYTVRLTVSNGVRSDSQDIDITVDSSFPDPASIKFAHVKNVMRNLSTCTTCHTPGSTPLPPIYYSDEDRDGSGGATDAIDDAWFHRAVLGRVNKTEVKASPLLRKPSGNHHNSGGTPLILGTTNGLSYYSMFYYWILNGTPTGGVIADAGADSTETLTFSGSPLSASVPLDGNASVGAVNYAWSVVSQPVGGNASFTNSAIAAPSLNVENVGVYVVELQVSNGSGDIDTAQRQIIVDESAITANFTPGTGSTAVNFSGAPSAGTIILTNTSTGNPTSCRWQVTQPAGVTGTLLDGSTTLDVTKSCASTANLTVPGSAVGAAAYQVQLTASNIGPSSAMHSVTVTSGTPVVASIVVSSNTGKTFTGGVPPGTPGTASVTLNSTGSSGVLPLTYAWSITSQPDATNGVSSLSSAAASAPTLTVRATGSYTVQLIVTDNVGNNDTTTSIFSVTSSGTTFGTVKGLFVSTGCTGCHGTFAAYNDMVLANNSGTEPSWVDQTVAGQTLWRRVFQRVNLSISANSLLLLNPSLNAETIINTNSHGGGCQPGFNVWGEAAGVASHFCADTSGANYNSLKSWIDAGAPPGN